MSPGKGSSFFHFHTPMPAQVLFSEQKYSLAQVILLRIACGVCGVTGIWGRSNDQKPLALLTVNCMYLVCSPRSRTFPADDTGSASSPVCDVPALKRQIITQVRTLKVWLGYLAAAPTREFAMTYIRSKKRKKTGGDQMVAVPGFSIVRKIFLFERLSAEACYIQRVYPQQGHTVNAFAKG